MRHSHRAEDELYYVAPIEAPPSRRPPLLTVGPVGWLRKNLFGSAFSTILTVVTVAVVALFVYELFHWSVQTAEWGVVNNNLRLMMAGLYPVEELWRVEVLGMLMVFLSGLGLGIWGTNGRAFFLTVFITILLVVLIPIGGQRLPETPIRFIAPPSGDIGPLMFVGDEGQTVEVMVEPIDRQRYATAEETAFVGFLENTPGPSNSRSIWNDAKAQAVAGTLDLSQYNLQLTVQLLDANLRVLDEALSTPNRRTVRFKVELPEDAWYAVRVLRDDTGEPVYREIDGVRLPISPARPLPNTGYAWVRLDGVATFSTRSDNLQHLTERYGELPAYPCPTTRECRRQVAENDLRFDGARTFGEFVRIQLDPFLQGIAAPLVVGFVVLCIGWIVGRFAKQNRNPRTGKWVSSLTIVGWLALFPLSWIILGGFDDSQAIHPNLIMPKVPTNVWGGLVLTILLTFVAITASFPIGVVLALGRRSQLPIISLFSTLFIEVVRGVPLITILFMAKFIVRYFADSLSEMELIVRLMIGLTLFTAAYVAEIVRGGLQIIPKGQIEASEALGLNPFLTNTFIVLPQALRAVIPALMSQFVSLFKDTTLVSIVGSFELLGMVEIIVTGQQIYRPFQREAYLFVGAIYFILSFVMSSVSRRLEETGSGTTRRLR